MAQYASPPLELRAFLVESRHLSTPALLYGIAAMMGNVSQSGATLTANRLDGVTPAMTFTLDSATAPTARRRAA